MCRSEVIENARRCLLDIGQLQHVDRHWRLMQAPAPANAGAVGGDAGHRAHRPTGMSIFLCWDPALQPQRQL